MTKRPTRKKRIQHIYGTTVEEVDKISLTYDGATDSIHFGQEMMNTYSEVSYERAKGKKVICRIPQLSAGITHNVSQAIVRGYDFLCAVDTNTRIIGQKRVSVVAIVIFQQADPPPGAREYWQLDVPFCLEYVEFKVEKPENFGWMAALAELTRRGFIEPSARVGMVVDSDLSNLHAYNSRSMCVIEDSLLPSNATLIYASGDTGKEMIINRVLAVADTVAGQMLDAISGGKVPFNNEKLDHPCYEGIRLIHPRRR